MKAPAKLYGLLMALAACCLLTACSGGEGGGKKEAGKPPVAVEVQKISPGDFSQYIEVVGSLSPKFEASLKSEFQGQIAQVLVTEWVRVKKGQTLARLDTREINAVVNKAKANVEAARAALLQAEVGATRAKREHARLMKLKDAGLVTAQALDDARSEEEAALARQEAAKAQLQVAQDEFSQARTRLDKANINAPLDGVVAYRGVNVGDMVGEAGTNKILFRVVDNRLLDLSVTVPSKEIRHLALGQELLFNTDAFPGQEFKGKVMYINPAVSEGDRSLKVIAEVPNAEELLKSGLFVKGRIITGQRQGALLVPRSALHTWDVNSGKGELWVREGEGATRRQVKTGELSGEMVEISSGLKPGEEVVVRGGFNLRDGDKIQIAPGNGA